MPFLIPILFFSEPVLAPYWLIAMVLSVVIFVGMVIYVILRDWLS